MAALQLPYIYLPFPFSGTPVSSQYLDTILSYWLGLSLVPLSCHIPSFVAVARSTGPNNEKRGRLKVVYWFDRSRFKGIVSWGFLVHFFHESFSPKRLKITFIWVILNFWENSRRYLQITVHHCTGINDTGNKFATGIPLRHWYWWQIMGTIWDCLHLK